jgi:parallel beta-helix repeat protein
MRCLRTVQIVTSLLFVVGMANAQLIVEDFDDQTTGSPPAWLWWNNGSSGTILVDETTSRGGSGKSVEILRTTFDGYGFGFGRNFPPIDGKAELTFYFRVGSTTDEVLTAVGGNNAGHQVAWWVGVGGDAGDAIGTHSHSGGWNHVMDVSPDTWYGVKLEIDPAALTYDITVWEDGNPGNTATETGLPFRDGSDVEVIDQIQFGNFSDATSGPAASAFIDDVEFVGTRVLKDDFESGNTGMWSWSTRPRTAVTTCYQTVTTDAYLANDITCSSLGVEDVAVELGASNIFLDLNGYTIEYTLPQQAVGIGVRAMYLEGVTIKNGTIKNFNTGVQLTETVGSTVHDVLIMNLGNSNPDDFLNGIRTSENQGLRTRDCFFHFLPVHHRTIVNLASSTANIDNIEVNGGGVGINIFGDDERTNCTLTNSRLMNTVHSGVLVFYSDSVVIADNEFTRSPINVEEYVLGNITGVTIEDNLIEAWEIGIYFWAGSNSTVQNNIVRNHFSRGIHLGADADCPEPPTPACIFATGNVVTGNTVTGNPVDLSHHPNALGNTWTDNICETTEGSEIRPCIPPGP